MPTKLFYKNIEQKILSNLTKAKKEVKIAIAWFTNPILFDVVLKLVDNGINIELVLCDDRINFTNPKLNFQKLIDLGVNVRVSKFPNLMHNKFCVIDNRILINGSYNWTLRAEQFNFENIIITTDKELISDFTIYFNELKDKTNRIISVTKSTFQTYQSVKEMDFEIQLEKSPNSSLVEIEHKEKMIYNDKINKILNEAELIYRNAEHLKCIEYCKKQIREFPEIPDFHLIIASSYWRTNQNKKLVASAQKAIDINNELWDAYNLLGIGYSRIAGKEQQSIKNYNICLTEYPNEHTFLRNRAISNINLESDMNIPKKFRDKYKEKADQDLKKIIQIVTDKTEKEQSFHALHSRAIAYSFLNKISLAIKDINLAFKKYNAIQDKFELDKNEYIEMKEFQRNLKNYKKPAGNTV